MKFELFQDTFEEWGYGAEARMTEIMFTHMDVIIYKRKRKKVVKKSL